MPSIRLADLAQQLDAELHGDGDIVITGVASMQSAQTGHITFMVNPKYREHLGLCQASAVVMTQDDLPFAKSAALVVKNPYLTYARMAQILDTTPQPAQNIAPSAVIDATAKPMLLMCADSASVLTAYRAAYSRGLCVGADVSILGVGMIPPDLPLWPTLTGFVFDTDEVITSLAARLIHGLEGAANPQRHSLTDYRWMPGDSCAQYAP